MDQRLPEPAVTDWRELCAELADALDHNRQCLLDDRSLTHPLADKARAALAQPESEVVGPSDEELDDLFTEIDQGGEPLSWLAFARAVLARWGRPDPAPAEGEVAELVEGLRMISDGMSAIGHESDSWFVARAADLLERQAAPVPVLPEDAQVIEPTERTILVPPRGPVAVSERLPGEEDCDAQGRVWWLGVDTWMLRSYALIDGTAIPLGTHWLPAHALPLPSGEVE